MVDNKNLDSARSAVNQIISLQIDAKVFRFIDSNKDNVIFKELDFMEENQDMPEGSLKLYLHRVYHQRSCVYFYLFLFLLTASMLLLTLLTFLLDLPVGYLYALESILMLCLTLDLLSRIYVKVSV